MEPKQKDNLKTAKKQETQMQAYAKRLEYIEDFMRQQKKFNEEATRTLAQLEASQNDMWLSMGTSRREVQQGDVPDRYHDLAMRDGAFQAEHFERRRREALLNRAFILQAARNEIQGREPKSDPLVDAFKQKVTNLQWLVAERGPRVQELLEDPQARDLFTSDNFNILFGALDKDPTKIKAKILSDVLRLDVAQIASRDGNAGAPDVEATRVVIRELLVFWGPELAKECWDFVAGAPDEFYPIGADQLARFSGLLNELVNQHVHFGHITPMLDSVRVQLDWSDAVSSNGWNPSLGHCEPVSPSLMSIFLTPLVLTSPNSGKHHR